MLTLVLLLCNSLAYAWFPTSLNIFVNPSLKLAENTHGIRGVFTDATLAENEVLCGIPLDSTLSCYSYLDEEEDIPWPIELSLKIVTEMRKGEASLHYEYFQMLPSQTDFQACLPVYWSVTDELGLGVILEDQAQYVDDYNCDLILEEIQRLQLWRKDTFDNVIPSLLGNSKYAHLVPPDLEKEEFLYALDNALTRNCAVIDHGSNGNDGNNDNNDRDRPRKFHLMSPLFDMFNHAFDESAHFSLNTDNNNILLEVNVKEGHSIQQGKEVCISYKAETSFKDSLLEAQEYFWVYYGFVPEIYSIYITLPPSVTSAVLIEALKSNGGSSASEKSITVSTLLKQRAIAISDTFELCPSTVETSDLLRALIVYCASPEQRKALDLSASNDGSNGDDEGIESDVSVVDASTLKKATDSLLSLLQEMQEVLACALESSSGDNDDSTSHPATRARYRFRESKLRIIKEAMGVLSG